MEQTFVCRDCTEPYTLECALEIKLIEAECPLCNNEGMMRKQK